MLGHNLEVETPVRIGLGGGETFHVDLLRAYTLDLMPNMVFLGVLYCLKYLMASYRFLRRLASVPITV